MRKSLWFCGVSILAFVVAVFFLSGSDELSSHEMMAAIGGGGLGTKCEKCPGSSGGCSSGDMQGGVVCSSQEEESCLGNYEVLQVRYQNVGSCSITDQETDWCCWYVPVTCKKCECIVIEAGCYYGTSCVNIQHNRCVAAEICG